MVVTISRATRRHRRLHASGPSHTPGLVTAGRRRLADDGVTVEYDVAVDDGDVMKIANRVDGYTDEQIDVVISRAAATADVVDEFATLVTRELGEFSVSDPALAKGERGGDLAEYEYTVGPTMSLAPSRSPAPSLAPSTAAP